MSRRVVACACVLSSLLSFAAIAAATEPAAAGPAGGTQASVPNVDTPRETAIEGALNRLGVAAHLAPLTHEDSAFLTWMTPPRAPTAPVGAVLMVPAPAAAISDPLIQALARIPPRGGWLTLAMQPPPGNAAQEAICSRLAGSLVRLKSLGNLPIVLAGVGGSLDASLACYAGKLPAEIVGVAALGRWHTGLEALTLPVLDLVPAIDPVALRVARERAISAEKRRPGTYLQVAVDVADERFAGGEEEVAKRLRGWLGQFPRTSSR